MYKLLIVLFSVFYINIFSQDSLKNFHFQLTAINQGHLKYNALYSGRNSLNTNADKAMSLTSTFYFGYRIHRNTTFYFNPEIMGGNGMSDSKGMAGFTNGETFRIDNSSPKLYVARLFIRQYFPLRNTEYLDVNDDVNQLKEKIPTSRIQLTFGKFSIVDFFDKSIISRDPRTDFMNWSLMSNAGWDYPSNTRGYTEGIVLELIKPKYGVRFSVCKVPTWANGPNLDPNIFKAYSLSMEVEKKYFLSEQSGSVKFLLTYTKSKAPRISTIVNNYISGIDTSLNIITSSDYRGVKYGYAFSWEHCMSMNTTMLFRTSWNDGRYGTWAFTEIDKSTSMMIRKYKLLTNTDNFGMGYVSNGLSQDHINFYKLGGYGFMIGDGNLNYAPEQILELFYQYFYNKLMSFTFDYQYVINPAYNVDRGPVHVFAIRSHIQF